MLCLCRMWAIMVLHSFLFFCYSQWHFLISLFLVPPSIFWNLLNTRRCWKVLDPTKRGLKMIFWYLVWFWEVGWTENFSAPLQINVLYNINWLKIINPKMQPNFELENKNVTFKPRKLGLNFQYLFSQKIPYSKHGNDRWSTNFQRRIKNWLILKRSLHAIVIY